MVVKIPAERSLRVKAGQHILVLENVQPMAQLNACAGTASGERRGPEGIP